MATQCSSAINAIYEENQGLALQIDSTDRGGLATQPSSLTYQVDCRTTNAVIIAETQIPYPAASFEFVVPDAAMVIQDEANHIEMRRITFTALASDSFATVSTYDFALRNTRLGV